MSKPLLVVILGLRIGLEMGLKGVEDNDKEVVVVEGFEEEIPKWVLALRMRL